VKKLFTAIAFIFVLFGALNWGLWGFFQFDFVAWFSKGNDTWLSRFLYSLIGLCGLWILRMVPPMLKHMWCEKGHCKKSEK
jgi:uncharacterized protein